MRVYVLALILLSAACVSPDPAPETVTETPTLTGEVRIAYPQSQARIYAEVLFLAGTARSVPDGRFGLRLVGPDENIIARTVVETRADGGWQIEMLHGYSGDPAEVVIEAVPLDGRNDVLYSAVEILMAGIQHRPEGLSGGISAPGPGETVGGEVIAVRGGFSGVPGNVFWLALVDADGATVDEREIVFHNPYVVDVMPWFAELSPKGYRGPAALRAFVRDANGSIRLLDTVEIVLIQEAG